MDDNRILKGVIIIIVALLLLIITLLLIYYKLQTGDSTLNVEVTIPDEDSLETVADVIKKYDSRYIEEDNNNIYVSFSKDLYEEDGSSNEPFFNKLTTDLTKFFEKEDFFLIDSNKNIKIYVRYDKEQEKHIIIINDIENYYENNDGKTYVEIENVNYAKLSKTIGSKNTILNNLKSNGMSFKSIEEILGSGIELDDGYISYLNGKVKLRKVRGDVVRNIIFSRDYEEQIFTNFENDATLKEIYNKNSNNWLGSVEEGYLCYRTDSLYYFIYEDEISIYGYSYSKNKIFEKALEKYLSGRDFKNFIDNIILQMVKYDYCEYDIDEKTAHIMFSYCGIEIDIKDNNPKGIILYNNYYFTDLTKQYVKDGLISFRNNENSIEKMELERKGNF